MADKMNNSRQQTVEEIYGYLSDSENPHFIHIYGFLGIGKREIILSVIDKLRTSGKKVREKIINTGNQADRYQEFTVRHLATSLLSHGPRRNIEKPNIDKMMRKIQHTIKPLTEHNSQVIIWCGASKIDLEVSNKHNDYLGWLLFKIDNRGDQDEFGNYPIVRINPPPKLIVQSRYPSKLDIENQLIKLSDEFDDLEIPVKPFEIKGLETTNQVKDLINRIFLSTSESALIPDNAIGAIISFTESESAPPPENQSALTLEDSLVEDICCVCGYHPRVIKTLSMLMKGNDWIENLNKNAEETKDALVRLLDMEDTGNKICQTLADEILNALTSSARQAIEDYASNADQNRIIRDADRMELKARGLLHKDKPIEFLIRYANKKKDPEDMFKYKVFIAHSSKNKDTIENEIIPKFDQNSISYWFDSQQINLDSWITAEIEDGLRQSQYLLVCISSEYSQSRWGQGEYAAILNQEFEKSESKENRQKILVLMLEDNKDNIPPLIRDKLRTHLNKDEELSDLLDFLKK